MILTIAHDVPDNTVRAIKKHMDRAFKTDVLFNGENYRIERGDFTEMDGGKDASNTTSLFREVLDIIQNPPKPGRPAILKGSQRVNTTLDAETIAICTAAGSGNLSEGIRILAKAFAEAQK